MESAPLLPLPDLDEAAASQAQEIMERFVADLDKESDRGAVLSCLAYFDSLLARCLEAYFCQTDQKNTLLTPNGILGSFEAKNQLCLSLRIINGSQFKTLKLMARIRNRFAHNVLIDFHDATIGDRVSEMSKVFYADNPYVVGGERSRQHFCLVAFSLNDLLWLRPLDINIHSKMYGNIIPYHMDKLLDSESTVITDRNT
jgi:hypothetical protein